MSKQFIQDNDPLKEDVLETAKKLAKTFFQA